MPATDADQIERLFERGVTDGLPVVPPTRERVARAVEASGRPADELIGLVPPNFGRATVEKIRRAQDLLSHGIPTRNLAQELDQVHDLAIPQLEKQKFATTDRPHAARPATPDSRHIPAEVRRAVYARDGGRCTFIDARGRRCESRHQLEYDHIVPVARGGTSTVGNVRALCRAHNQIAAIDAFGLAFMGYRIEQARAERAADLPPAVAPS